jgi:hypothetical protein
MSYVVKFFLTFTFSFDYRPTMIRAIYVSIISVSVTLFFPFAPIVITNMQFWPPLSWHYFLRKTVNTACILYNYIEETRLQSIYQFSDHATYARRLPFLPSTVIYFIPKCLSFMVLLMSNRPDDSIGAVTTGNGRHKFTASRTRLLHCPVFSLLYSWQPNIVNPLWCSRSNDIVDWNYRVAVAQHLQFI